MTAALLILALLLAFMTGALLSAWVLALYAMTNATKAE